MLLFMWNDTILSGIKYKFLAFSIFSTYCMVRHDFSLSTVLPGGTNRLPSSTCINSSVRPSVRLSGHACRLGIQRKIAQAQQIRSVRYTKRFKVCRHRPSLSSIIFTYWVPMYVVCRPSSVVRRPSSVVRPPSSVVRRPSSIVRCPLSLLSSHVWCIGGGDWGGSPPSLLFFLLT